jgi:short-subunit dehydrogenase
MEETVRTALITGASAGLGAEFAKRLAEDGYSLILVARRLERLQGLAGDLREWFEVPVEALRADLTEANDLRNVEERIAGDETLELVINNAGFPAYMPFAELPPEKAEELIRLQILAVTRLTRAALPGMIARGRGGIVNVSSMTANSASLPPEPLPNRVTYAATKAYVNAFTELLSHELAGTGVRVQALNPGLLDTPEFHDFDIKRIPVPAMSPEDVVQASLRGLELGEVICAPAVEDTSLITKLAEAQRNLISAGRANQLASRYRK